MKDAHALLAQLARITETTTGREMLARVLGALDIAHAGAYSFDSCDSAARELKSAAARIFDIGAR